MENELISTQFIGNRYWIEQVFRSRYKQIHRVAFKMVSDYYLAQDICQDSFLRLLTNEDKLEINCIEKAYQLICIGIRWAVNDMRDKESTREKNRNKIEAYFESLNINKNAAILFYPVSKTIIKSIPKLPGPMSQIIKSHYFEHLELKEIADRLNLGYDRVCYFRIEALKRLKTGNLASNQGRPDGKTHEIVKMRKEGVGYAQIAEELGISESKAVQRFHYWMQYYADSKEKEQIQNRDIKRSTQKLTWVQVIEIRECWHNTVISKTDLAKKFEVSRSMINYIINGKRWQNNKMKVDTLQLN
jgi:RNA polymerase sigma factor (sigma-70 family)